MKLFKAIIETGNGVSLVTGTATNKAKFKEKYWGNGDFIKITDITHEHLNENTIDTLYNDLRRCGWGENEIMLISALVEEHLKKRGDLQ